MENPARFNMPIKRNEILNFSACAINKKKVNGDLKIIKFERNLFARILKMSLNESIDMQAVLSYPITPIPLSLCHPDGTIYKTNKAQLMKVLESEVTSLPPNGYDTIIYDAMSLLHMIGDIPLTYGGVVKCILQKICKKSATNIHLIFDTYFTPSIKDLERNRRSTSRNVDYIISGFQQKRPSNFSNALQSDSFKTNFVKFFVDHLSCSNSNFAYIIDKRQIYVTVDTKCLVFTIENGVINVKENQQLYCEH